MDAKQIVQDYWPWFLGGVVGLYLIMSRSSGSGGSVDYSGYLAAQAAAAQGNSQASIAQSQIAAQSAIANRQLDLAETATKSEAQTNYLIAQGAIAEGVGKAAGSLVSALYSPYLAALNSAAYENSSALQSAAAIAIGGFNAQKGMLETSSTSIGAVAEGLKAFTQVQAPRTTAGSIIGGATQLGTTAINSWMNSGLGYWGQGLGSGYSGL